MDKERKSVSARERRILWSALTLVVVAVNLPLLALVFRPAASVAFEFKGPFSDDFNREEIGEAYQADGGYWRIANNELFSPGTKNNPLWLRAALPADVQVEFDARSDSRSGDVKCEIFGDGYEHASGYLVVFGAESNTLSMVARLSEAGVAVDPAPPDPLPNGGEVRVERRGLRVEPGRSYHWTVRRRGGLLSWALDGQLALEMNDPHPLAGPRHDRFAFTTWDSDVFYDNLKITPL